MTDERRYRDDEIAEIFEAAAAETAAPPERSRRDAGSAHGMTLAELQAIGREVGIAPERIAEAARSLDRVPARAPRRRDFGMPISVGRTVELPRAPTDREWAMLVTELRATFNARGHEQSQGELRHWRNGNLHAFVEPTPTGYRLRLGTLKGDALALNRLGAGMTVVGLAMALAAFLVPGADVGAALPLGAMGAGAFGYNALRLPRWVREREEQMDYIADRARALIGAAPDSAD